VTRRRKEEVLSDLPEQTVNNDHIELSEKQAEIPNGYLAARMPLLNKKFLTRHGHPPHPAAPPHDAG
jgi:hypothetical protein